MGFNWKLYVDLADELVNHQRTAALQEAYFRTAISRSYYGVFCIAKSYLVSQGVDIPKKDTHKFVRERYEASASKRKKGIGEWLKTLWKKRLVADYEDQPSVARNDAVIAYMLATKALEELQHIGAS